MHPHAIKLAQIVLLVASGAVDAHSTIAFQRRAVECGRVAYETNPLLRPVAGTKWVYPAIVGGDLMIYWSLHGLHKPRAAKWFLHLETGENFFCAWNNQR